MKDPLILTNFKNYPQATLGNAEILLRKFSEVRIPGSTRLIYSVSPVDFGLAGKFPDMNLYAQHVDFNDPGACTGKVTMEGLKQTGMNGSLLNHSENRISEDQIKKTVEKSNRLDFEIILCVESPQEAEKYARYHPSYIAYEPPELIGGDISVSTSKPEIISDVVSICNRFDLKVLVGAGVKDRNDLTKSLELGAEGVLIASGIVKAKDPLASLTSLISS